VCINQFDRDTKARGIDQIGRFLRNSEELLILWSPDYFSRLWCCFELALFLQSGDPPGDGEPGQGYRVVPGTLARQSSAHAEQQQRKIVLVPLGLAMAGFVIAAICTLGVLAFRVTMLLAIDLVVDSNAFIGLAAAAAACTSFPLSVMSRTFAIQRRELHRQMRSFTFSEARSFSEEDRPVLRHIISVTYQAGGDSGDDPDGGIARFEQHVRSRMPAVVNSLLGPPSVVPPKLLALFGSTIWLYFLDGIAGNCC
jgi:hypothetical protein